MASRAILSNFFEEQRTQNNPRYFSRLSRALSPTTFLEIAVYIDGKKLKYAQKNFMEEWLAYEKQ